MRAFTRTAAACFAAALSFAASADEDPLAIARENDRKGAHVEALFYYGKVLAQNPKDRVALFELGMMEARLGLREPAAVQLERLREACGALDHPPRSALRDSPSERPGGSCAEAARLERAIANPTEVGRADTVQPAR